jgi:antitoxin component YwqK of YwqJK toxin-antitoxin module
MNFRLSQSLLLSVIILVLLPVSVQPQQASQTLFYNENPGRVTAGPAREPAFTLKFPAVITLIRTYHWNDGQGETPGTIGLRGQTGKVYGPWPASGQAGNKYWIVRPNARIPAGTYQVLDSSPSTWSCNQQSRGYGFAMVDAELADADVREPGTDKPGAENSSGAQSAATSGRPPISVFWGLGMKAEDLSLPTATPPTRVLTVQHVQPSTRPQDFAFGGRIKVTVPPGEISRACDLILSESPPPSNSPDELKHLASYRIDLGDRHEFNLPITIEVPYDPALVPQGRSAEEVFMAAYWHERSKVWVLLPTVADPVTKTLRTFTRHLTLVSWWSRGINWFLRDAIKTDHFILWYSAKKINAANSPASDRAWSASIGPEVVAGTEPLGAYRRQGSDIVPVRHEAGVPLYIEYVAQCLEYAYNTYKMKGLRVPSWTRHDVFVGVGGGIFGDDPYHTKFSGVIYIPPLQINTPRAVRGVTAHELCHGAQTEYLSFDMMAMTLRKWWLEATAEYGAKMVWGDAMDYRGMDKSFFQVPLTTSDDDHEYNAARFVQMLVEKKRSSFSQMLEFTLNVGTVLNAAETAHVVDYAIIDRLIGYKEPFGSYTRTITLGRLENFYLARNQTLINYWREFAGYTLFDASSELLGVGGSLPSAQMISRLGLDNPELNVQAKFVLLPLVEQKSLPITVPGDYACYVWAVRAEMPPGLPKDGARALNVTADKNLPTGFTADIYLLKGNKRIAGVKPAGTIAANNITREVPLKVGPDDEIYVLATNFMIKPVQATINICNDAALTLDPPRILDAKPAELYTFRAQARLLPLDTKDFRLRWDFGDGTKGDLDSELDRTTPAVLKGSYAHKFDKPGTYQVKVQVIEGVAARVRAEATVDVVMSRQPAIRLVPPDINVQTNIEVEINAAVDNPPAKAQYVWSLGPTVRTSASPTIRYAFPLAGKVDLSIALEDQATGRIVATAKGTATVEDGEQVRWIKEFYDDGKLSREYQELVATRERHGPCRTYYRNGVMGEDALYKRDKMVRTTRWWESGKPQYQANFNDNGKMNGQEITYYQNGVKQEENYWLAQSDTKPSLKDGVFRKYHQDGSLAQETTYVSDVLHGPMKELSAPDAQGKQVVLVQGAWAGGKRVGDWVFRKGDLRLEEKYVDGKRHGLARRYNGKGQVYVEEEYENDKVRVRRYYDDAGNVKETERDPSSKLYW